MSDAVLQSSGHARWVRIAPVVFLMYTISFFDRVNIGLALPSITHDLHLSSAQAGLAGGVFFWGYFLTFLGAGWLAPRFGGRQVILVCLILWGALAMATGLAENFAELLVMRFLLGAAEGPVWTAASLLLSQWFVSRERGRAFGLWNLCIPVGALLAGPVSGLILSYFSWHVMFVFEGLPAWLWAVVWWLTIPKTLKHAEWLSTSERQALSRALASEQEHLSKQSRLGWRQILVERNVWYLLCAFSLINMVSYGFSLWLPTAIKQANHLNIASVGLLSALPYLASIFGIVFITWSSDRRRERRYHTALPMVITGVLLWFGASFANHSPALQIFSYTLMGFFLFMFLPLMFSFVTEILPHEMSIPAIAFIGGIGNLFGGFVGPTIVGWVRGITGSFDAPFVMLAVFGVAGGLAMLLVRPTHDALMAGDGVTLREPEAEVQPGEWAAD